MTGDLFSALAAPAHRADHCPAAANSSATPTPCHLAIPPFRAPNSSAPLSGLKSGQANAYKHTISIQIVISGMH